jgi:hypothetical protein
MATDIATPEPNPAIAGSETTKQSRLEEARNEIASRACNDNE